MRNFDICKNIRHQPIAYEFNGTIVDCPLCILLDEKDDYEQLFKLIANLQNDLENGQDSIMKLNNFLTTLEKKL
jgi:Zn-finger protein